MSIQNRVLSNKKVTVWLGPDSGIADYEAPTLAEVTAMVNVSEAVKWDGFDFNISASDQGDDRSLVDQAGSQSRSYDQFGGAIAFFTPKPGDTTSILRVTRNIVKTPRTRLAVVIRTVTLNSAGIAVGDEVNAYRTITDANSHVRGDISFSYTINFIGQDDIGVNCIIPSAVPTAVTALPPGSVTTPISIAVGGTSFSTAQYEGRNVTVGAIWVSDAPLVASVSKHGIVVGLTAGTANVNATYRGSAAGTARAVTVA